MKKTLILGAFTLCLAAVSCEKKEVINEPQNDNMVTLNATIDAETKAAVSETGAFTWTAGDAISVYTSSNQFTIFNINADDAGKATANFKAVLDPGVTVQKYAVYPAGAHKCSGNTLTVNLPATYGSTDKEYAANANAVMTASVSGEDLAFHHAGGVIRFDVASVPAGAAKFVFKTKAVITGNFTVGGTATAPVISNSTSSSLNEVAILYKELTASANHVYYIPLPTGTYQGFTIELQKADGTVLASMTSAREQVLSRQALACIPELVVAAGQFLVKHAFELGDGSGNTWKTSEPSYQTNQNGVKLLASIKDGYLACQRVSQAEKDFRAQGTYAVKIAKLNGGRPISHLMFYQGADHGMSGGRQNEILVNPILGNNNQYTVIVRYAKDSSWEDVPVCFNQTFNHNYAVTANPMVFKFEKLENGYAKISIIINDEVIVSVNADGSIMNEKTTPQILYGSKIGLRIGNGDKAYDWNSDTFYEYWAYAEPAE